MVSKTDVVPKVYVLGFDLGSAKFQHAVLLVQDLINSRMIDSLDPEGKLAAQYTSSWEVYIGNSSVWSQNIQCAGGPYLSSAYDDYKA